MKNYRFLGKILLDEGLLTTAQLQKALQTQKKTGTLLGRILIELGYVTEADVLRALGAQSGMETVSLVQVEIPRDVLDSVSPTTVKLHGIIPLAREGNTIVIAMSDPLNVSILDELRFLLNRPVKGVIAEKDDITALIERYYHGKGDSVGDLITEIEEKIPIPHIEEFEAPLDTATDAVALQELANQAPVVRLVNLILMEAIKKRASDIHFEPFEEIYSIRCRIDGVLYEIASPPKNLSLAISSRLKVIANLDIAERRLPQDGRVSISVDRRQIDLRLSTLPTIFGESVVIRVLDKTVVNLSLTQLGMEEDMQQSTRRIINRPNGIILVTGPTGSGKTTTLYACLREVNKIDYKIITTEDPVEYDMPGIIQVPIRPKINLNFATCLRHILRQDPDIIMVGEIRDVETAQIAIQASLTGHLVFSTLHTNDACSAVTRLINMGVEPYLISSTLEAVVAQRLVRVLCQACRQAYVPDERLVRELGGGERTLESGQQFYRARGCPECNHSGYRGRTGIYEMLLLTPDLKALILKQTQTSVIRQAAIRGGMRTMREDGLLKICHGVTTPDEVLRETMFYR